MRILICTNSLGAKGGIERVTIVKANALADIDGNEVAVCYTDKGTYPENTIHPLSPKVKVYDLGVTFWDLYPLGLKKLLVTAPRKFTALRRAIKKTVAEFMPDVVISTGSYEKYALATIRLKAPSVKVREYHFNSNYRRFNGSGRLLRLAGYIDNHLFSRGFHRNFLLTAEDAGNFKGKKRFDYQHNPCSFKSEGDVSFAREDVVLAVGRLEDQKNISELLDIWGAAHTRMPGWQLWIVGDGSQRSMLEKQAARLGIDSSVKFLGFRKDVQQLLLKSKMLAMTSKYEGMPLNLIEAMHCAVVPIVYTFPYGARDVITDNTDGVLVDYLDRKQFAQKLVELAADSERLLRIGEAAKRRAADFSPDRIARQWMDKYTQLIALRKR